MSDKPWAAPSSVDAPRSRALGESTRSRVLRYLEESEGPVRVAAIADDLGLNHTGIRRHLAALRDAGLVIEERARSGAPGRPPLEYRAAAPGAGERGGVEVYEELSLLLLGIGRDRRSPRAVGVEEGRRIAGEAPAGESLERVRAEMSRRGFDPELRQEGPVVELVAGRCGVEAAAAADPDLVCEIHRGMIEGMLEGTGGKLELRAAFRYEPSRGGCRFRIGPTRP